jgi:membrane-associated phospholipid phosphatase
MDACENVWLDVLAGFTFGYILATAAWFLYEWKTGGRE